MKTSELDNIDEVEIMEETPKRVRIGARFVLIRQLTIREYFWLARVGLRLWLKYAPEFTRLYHEFTNTEKRGRLKMTADFFVAAVRMEGLRRECLKILNRLFPSVGKRLPFGQSYLERHATPNDIMQLIFGLYQYNIGDVKKNWELLLAETGNRETRVSSNLKQPSRKDSDGPKDGPTIPRYVRLKNMSGGAAGKVTG